MKMTALYAAKDIPLDHLHTRVFFYLTVTFLGLTLLPAVVKNRGLVFERRSYWGGTAGAAVSSIIAGIPNWAAAIGCAVLIVYGMTMAAYFRTPYIKIKGKVRAFHTYDELADPGPVDVPPGRDVDPDYDPHPDQYGNGVAATKGWWLLVPVVALCVATVLLSIFSDGSRLHAIFAALFLVVCGLIAGFGDASWDYPIARKQTVQFVLAAIASAGTFTALYLIGYSVGRRWPYRAKRSLERAVHPRFRDK